MTIRDYHHRASPNTRSPLFWLLLIMALGAALRLYNLAGASIWFDEGVTIFLAKYLTDPLKFLDPEYCNDAPLHIVLSALWYQGVLALPGVTRGTFLADYLIRLYPALIGVLTIPLIVLVGRQILNREAPALLAAFLFAISPFQIYYAQDLRAYPLHVLLNLAAVFFMLKALQENRLRHWIGLVLAMSAGIYNHFYMVWCIFAINLCYFALLPRYWRLIGHWTAANLAVILIAAPALRMALYVSLVFDTAWETWYPPPGLGMAVITVKNFFAGYSGLATMYRPLAALAVLFLGLGALTLWKRPQALVLLLVLAFVPIVASVIYWQNKDFPYYTHRLLIFSAVPIYLLVGQGIAVLRKPWAIAPTVAAFALLTTPLLHAHYKQDLHPLETHTTGILYKQDNRAAARFIQEHLQDGDAIVHRARYTYMPFIYYLGHEQKVVELTERGIIGAMIGYPSIRGYEIYGTRPVLLDSVLGQGNRLWVVVSWWRPFDREADTEALTAWLDHQFVRELRVPFDGLTVYRYRLDAPLPPDARVMQLADNATAQLPYYGGVDPGNLQGWSENFTQSWEHIITNAERPVAHFTVNIADPASVDPSQTLAQHPGGVLVPSFPLVSEDPVTYSFDITNPSDLPQEFEVEIHPSTELLPAMAFTFANPRSSVWRPAFQESMVLHQPPLPALSLVAYFTGQTPGDKAIYKDIALPPGGYTVWVRCAVTAAGRNMRGAHAHFGYGPPGDTPAHVGTVVPWREDGTSGWRWLEVGQLNATAAPARLTITASNPDQLPTAQFHLDRVLILPAESPVSPLEPQRHALTVAPQSSQSFQAAALLGGAARMRLDMRLFHPPTRETRYLNFYVQNRDPAVNGPMR